MVFAPNLPVPVGIDEALMLERRPAQKSVVSDERCYISVRNLDSSTRKYSHFARGDNEDRKTHRPRDAVIHDSSEESYSVLEESDVKRAR